MNPWTILSPTLAAIATALVAYLTRRRRIARTYSAIGGMLKIARHLVWTNTNWVLYTFIAVGTTFNLYQAQQVRRQAQNTQSALCSYRSDLKQRLNANENQLAFPRIFGLSKIAVQSIEATVKSERQAIRSLSHLGCP